MKPKWIFEPVGPMGGATGNAYVNTLQGAGMSPLAELAREAIQNSCDACSGDQRVSVTFRIERLEEDEKQNFLEALELDRAFGPRLGAIALAPEHCLASTTRPLNLLFIEDYGTIGLHGDPHKPSSHFHRLLLSIGDTAKVSGGTGIGGSYGYGKSALSLNSRIRTIVAYSSFPPDETGATARLMACAYFDAHEFDGRQWTGRAWYGVRRKSEELVVDPLQDDEAHEMAQRLGFRLRGPDDHGTSILVVDVDIETPHELLKAIEDWWWPRLVDNELEVQVEDSGQLYFPQPKQRQDLTPFIECYSLAVGRSCPTGPHQKSDRLYRFRGLELGIYSFQLLDEDASKDMPEDKIGTVALIRLPKMVIQYAQFGRSRPPAVGVFFAAPDIDEILKLSEPPTHDRWDANAKRLEIAQPDEDTARAVVRIVRDRLKRQMRKFQASAAPPKVSGEQRLIFLERQLASLFQPPLRGHDGRKGEVEPIEIRFREGPSSRTVQPGKIQTFAKVAVRLSQDADEEEVKALVRVCVPVLKHDHGAEDELLSLRIEHDTTAVCAEPMPEPEIPVILKKNEWHEFSLQTVPYDHEWTVKIRVEVISAEAEE